MKALLILIMIVAIIGAIMGALALSTVYADITTQPAIVIVPQLIWLTDCIGFAVLTAMISIAAIGIMNGIERLAGQRGR